MSSCDMQYNIKINNNKTHNIKWAYDQDTEKNEVYCPHWYSATARYV